MTLLAFGAVLLGPTLKHVSWQIALYAGLSLTVVRMLPVAIAMLGIAAEWPTVGFLGWFGPRGLASIVFAVITVEQAHLAGVDTILRATYLTIGLSVFAHGITAAPLARRYARWYETHPRHQRPLMESVYAPHHRARGRPRPPGEPGHRFQREQPPIVTSRPLPGVRALADYRLPWLRQDAVAGIVLTTLLVPQGMAYAELAACRRSRVCTPRSCA